MPFITEDIYTRLPGSEETIMLSAWPKADAAFSFPAEAAAAESAEAAAPAEGEAPAEA